MRVVIVSGIYPPDIGGPATHAPQLREELLQRGHDVAVVTLTDGPSVSRSDGVIRYPRTWPWPLRLVAVAVWLVRHRRRYDVVYATGLAPAAVGGAALARRPVVLKVVADPAWERARREGLTSTEFEQFQDHPDGGAQAWLMRALRDWTVRRADEVITPGVALGEAVTRWVREPGKVHVVPNGARPADPGPPIGRDHPGLHVVFVGRLVERKRVDRLIETMAEIEGVRLEIVGDGPERLALESLAQGLGLRDRVTFTGALTQPEAARRIAGADALLLASTHEGLPHVAVEALVNGVPLVTAPEPGTLEVVEHDVNGLVVDPPSPREFADALGRLAEDQELRRRLAEGAEAAGRRHHFSAAADAIEHLLLGAIDAPDAYRPRAVFVGRSRLVLPVPDDLRTKLAIHERYLESWSVTPGPVGVRKTAGTRTLSLPDGWPRPLTSALFYVLGPIIAVAIAARRRPSVVICQSPYEGLVAVTAARVLGRRRPAIQIEVHGDWRTATRLYGSPIRRALAPVADRLAMFALRRADRVRVVSERLGELVVESGYRGPLERHITFSDYRPFLEQPLVELPAAPVAVFVGVLEPYKAVDVLLDAWAVVAERSPEARLRLVGAGGREPWVRKRITELGLEGSVELVGRVPREDVLRQIDEATTLVLPSRSEGLPRIVVEAMARARPVVASTVGGMAELVVDGQTGRLVEPEDVLALADALLGVLGDRERARQMGQRGRTRVLERDPLGEYEDGIRALAAWAVHR